MIVIALEVATNALMQQLSLFIPSTISVEQMLSVAYTWKRQHVNLDATSVEEMYPPPKKEYQPLKRKVNDDDRKSFYHFLFKMENDNCTL